MYLAAKETEHLLHHMFHRACVEVWCRREEVSPTGNVSWATVFWAGMWSSSQFRPGFAWTSCWNRAAKSVKKRLRGNLTLKKSDRKLLHIVAVCRSSQHRRPKSWWTTRDWRSIFRNTSSLEQENWVMDFALVKEMFPSLDTVWIQWFDTFGPCASPTKWYNTRPKLIISTAAETCMHRNTPRLGIQGRPLGTSLEQSRTESEFTWFLLRKHVVLNHREQLVSNESTEKELIYRINLI